MPSKKRKYNARFPAGRIKKIMQTDEEVGKVAQAVPIIISRTLELFVKSLLSKAMEVTMSRNARTLSPSHVKQCILAETRFDFLRDLVKNVPDVSAAEEKEMVSAESSPNSSRYSDMSVPPQRIARQDSNSSSSSDIKPPPARDGVKRSLSTEIDSPIKCPKTDANPPTITAPDDIMDLSKKTTEGKTIVAPNFYQETLTDDELQPRSVITVNPTYSCQPSTSSYANLTAVEPVHRIALPVPKEPMYFLKVQTKLPEVSPPNMPVTPVLNIDFTKSLAMPEIKVLDNKAAGIVSKNKSLQRQNSKSKVKKVESKPKTADLDCHSGNLQIDEDYDT